MKIHVNSRRIKEIYLIKKEVNLLLIVNYLFLIVIHDIILNKQGDRESNDYLLK